MTIEQALLRDIKMWDEMGHSAIMQIFIHRNGLEFPAQPCPIPRMTPKECFRNAALMQLGIYCEGYGLRKEFPMLIHHAWRVVDGKVVDPTWDKPEECQYWGVLVPSKVLYEQLHKNGVYGLWDTGMINWQLMLELDPGMKEHLPDRLLK